MKDIESAAGDDVLSTRDGDAFVIDPTTAGHAVGRNAGKGRGKVDICICFDTTGSMSNKIEGLLQTSHRFVDELAGKDLSWQMRIVAFGDLTVPGDKIVATGFLSSIQAVRKALEQIPRYYGGANYGESSLEALEKAISFEGYRSDAIKVVLLLTDEAAHGADQKASIVIADLRHTEMMTFVISPDLPYFRRMAKETGGRWFEIGPHTDFTTILAEFENVARQVASRADNVRRLAGGSVSEYLRLPETKRGG